MWSRTRILLTLTGALLVLLFGVAWFGSHAPYAEAQSIGLGASSFKELSERFADLAKKKGGAYAFEVLRRAVVPPGTDLHLLGHVIGDALYQEKGIDGIEICTQDFRNACSHSIVIGALNEFGTGEHTIEQIRAACAEAPGGLGAYTMCFHGLGHGVFAYFQYDIPKTVAFCARLGTDVHHYLEYAQCVGGMIMELNDGGGHDRDAWLKARTKYLDERDPLAPCDRAVIPYDVKSYCYIYQTPRLLTAAGANLALPEPSTFPRAFSFCDAIPDASLRRTCYGSFGKEFVPIAAARDIRSIDQMGEAEYRLAIDWCALGGSSEASGACIEQALESVFWGGENDPNASFRFCALVTNPDDTDACYRTLATDIARYTREPSLHTALCERMPEVYRKSCEQIDTTGI